MWKLDILQVEFAVDVGERYFSLCECGEQLQDLMQEMPKRAALHH